MGKIILFILILTTSAWSNGKCTYETEQVIENGVVTHTVEIKKCVETEIIGKEKKEKFRIKDQLSDEQFQTAMIMTFVFILENLQKGGKYEKLDIDINWFCIGWLFKQ